MGTDTAASAYVMADAEFEAERERLGLLATAADTMTIYEMGRIGVGPGWDCLEVGAGVGSVPRQLVDLVGPTGRVVATDVDTRFLGDLPALGVEVRRHDVVKDELEESAYDVVHVRFLLLHLGDAAGAVMGRLARALRPGGWLLAEEMDPLTHALAPADDPDTEVLGRVVRTHWELLSRMGVHTDMGRRVPGLMRAAGLVEVTARGFTELGPGGSPANAALAQTIAAFRRPMTRRGLTADEIDQCVAALRDPLVTSFGPMVVASRGRAPLKEEG
jgi:SAM-dependent methyltransferase